MSLLSDRLLQQIRSEGPITFYQWMKAALYDPDEGYYCRSDRERWGREGDYRTSPERSELFGATFARYFAKLYQELGSPSTWTIVEVGAGAGHFAAELLLTLQHRFPEVFSATQYVLDEASAHSRYRAGQLLAKFGTQVQLKRLNDLANLNPGVIFSNELFDAFPVHRVTTQNGTLREFFVDADEQGSFTWTLGVPATPRLADYFTRPGIRLGEGRVVEVSLDLEDWFREAADKLTAGFLVTVDYGTEGSAFDALPNRRSTLRGFKAHQFVDDVLQTAGEQDITTTIDWTWVKQLGDRFGLKVFEFDRQDRFLLRAGILEEMEERVNKAVDESERLRLRTNAREMILPDGMAASFQVLVQKRVVGAGQ